MLKIGKKWALFSVCVAITSLRAESANEAVNAADFAALCGVYAVSKKGMEITLEGFLGTYYEERHVNESVQKIEELARTLNLTGDQGLQPPPAADSGLGASWLDSTEAVRRSLRRLLAKTQRLKRFADTLKKEIAADLKDIDTEFSQAILANDGKKVEEPTLKYGTSRDATCKAASSGNAGQSLALDFLCLCADDGGGSSTHPCGFAVKGGGASAWAPASSATDTAGGDSKHGIKNWKIIKDECDKFKAPRTLTALTIRRAVDAFLGRIGARGDAATGTTGASRFTLGIPHADGKCGDGSGHKPCVDYLDGTGKRKIDWLVRLETSEEKLEKDEKRRTLLNQTAEKLLDLTDRYDEIYEEIQATSNNKHLIPESPAVKHTRNHNPDITPDKVTAKELNSMSSTTLPRFILPWTLLL